jgi:hypothetical protein
MLGLIFLAGISKLRLTVWRRCCWSPRRIGSVDLLLNGSCIVGATAGRFRRIVLFVSLRNSQRALLSLAMLSADRALKARSYPGWRLPSGLRNAKQGTGYHGLPADQRLK